MLLSFVLCMFCWMPWCTTHLPLGTNTDTLNLEVFMRAGATFDCLLKNKVKIWFLVSECFWFMAIHQLFFSALDSSDRLTSQKNKPTEETLCNSAVFIAPSLLFARTFLFVCPIAKLQNQWDSIIFRRKMSASHPDSVAHHWNKSWGLRRV